MLASSYCSSAVHCAFEAFSAPARPRSTIAMALSVTGSKRKPVRIGTHSGTFHCDEALGCFMLKQVDTFRECEIVRYDIHD